MYKGWTIEKNEFGYYEARRDDEENYLFAKSIAQLKIDIDDLNA